MPVLCFIIFVVSLSKIAQDSSLKQYASPCEILWRLAELLLKCGDLMTFKMAAVRHLGFLHSTF